ncbi:MAG: Ig domain-containing protein [Oscillospiraceae bacterium]
MYRNRPECGRHPLLRDETVVMSVGATRKLLYDLDPWFTTHKDVVWSSDHEEIATVDPSGTVTAVREGSCTITVAAKDDPTKLDTCEIHVSALDLTLKGIVSAQSAGIGNVTGGATYQYDMVKSVATFGTEKRITWPEEFQGYGTSLSCSTLGRGSLWVNEYGNAGMLYEVDPETGVVKDMLEPIDGDMLFGMTYSETTDLFTGIMNFYPMWISPLPMRPKRRSEAPTTTMNTCSCGIALTCLPTCRNPMRISRPEKREMVPCKRWSSAASPLWKVRVSRTSTKITWANGLRPSITLPRPLWFCWTMWAACGTLTK